MNTNPLREPAAVIACMSAVARAKLDGADRALNLARDAGDFLIWAQQQAGAGCYPFPAAKSTSSARAMQVATRFLERAEVRGCSTEPCATAGPMIKDKAIGCLLLVTSLFGRSHCVATIFSSNRIFPMRFAVELPFAFTVTNETRPML